MRTAYALGIDRRTWNIGDLSGIVFIFLLNIMCITMYGMYNQNTMICMTNKIFDAASAEIKNVLLIGFFIVWGRSMNMKSPYEYIVLESYLFSQDAN